MEKINAESGDWKTRNHNNLVRLAMWTGAWLVTMALATFGPEFIWESNKGLTLTAILVSFGIGLGMIVANIRQLKDLDEMMQIIQLEAMGISLGIGVVGGLSFALLDTENIINFDAEIGYVIVLIGLTYLASCFILNKRYR